jgi:hypothetical protein
MGISAKTDPPEIYGRGLWIWYLVKECALLHSSKSRGLKHIRVSFLSNYNEKTASSTSYQEEESTHPGWSLWIIEAAYSILGATDAFIR